MPEVLVLSDFTRGMRKLNGQWTLRDLALRLEQVTGIPPQSQTFQFTTEAGYPGSPLSQTSESTTLDDIGVSDGWQIYVSDARAPADRLDFSDTETYEMPIEEYEKRSGTVLDWKRKNQLGRFAPNKSSEDPQPRDPQPSGPSSAYHASADQPVNFRVGDECFVHLLSGKTVRGTVAFVGSVPGLAEGPWVGVRLVSADGKNNGTVKGVHLFTAEPNHGTLVRPSAVRPLNADEEEL